MRNPSFMSPWLYFPLYGRRTDRDCLSQFLTRHCSTRHILRSRPFPLRPIDRSRIRHCCRIRALIPPIFRLYPPQYLNKNPLWGNVCRSQPNLLPPTLPRPSRHASTVLRLPRRLHPMKHSFIYRLPSLPRSRYYVPIHYLRGFRGQTRSAVS